MFKVVVSETSKQLSALRIQWLGS